MPLVRISLLEGRTKSVIEKISNVVHQAMVETISVPAAGPLSGGHRTPQWVPRL